MHCVCLFVLCVCVRSVKERVVETAERPVEQLQAWRQPAQQTQSELRRGRGAQGWRLPLWVALTATFLLDMISFFLSLFSVTLNISGVRVISQNFNSIIVHCLYNTANLCIFSPLNFITLKVDLLMTSYRFQPFKWMFLQLLVIQFYNMSSYIFRLHHNVNE